MTISNHRLNFSNTMTDHCPIENHPNFNSQAQDFCANIPCKIVVGHIFSYLNLHELSVIRQVSKQWEEFASEPILWQSAVYREIAFSSKNWAEWDADLVKDVDLKQEMLSLPKNIAEELRCSAFPGKSIRETHVLGRMLKGFTLKKLRELAKKYFPNNANDTFFLSIILDNSENKFTNESVWLLMAKEVLPDSINKSYNQQKDMIAKIAKTNEVFYNVPTILEAATCIVAEYFFSKKHLFNESPMVYTRCQESVYGYPFVGGFGIPHINFAYKEYTRDNIGIAALRKF